MHSNGGRSAFDAVQVLGGSFVPSVEAATFVEVELLEASSARSSNVRYKTRPSLNPSHFHEYNSREFLFQKVTSSSKCLIYDLLMTDELSSAGG